MKRPETRGLLARIAGPDDFAAAFEVSRETLSRLKVFADLLAKWQKTINLVAPSTLPEVWHRHIADSAQLLALAPAGATKWVDLGSGAGFPGLVIAILWAEQDFRNGANGSENKSSLSKAFERLGNPPRTVVLVESDVRKCAFLGEVVRKTGISASLTVEIMTGRIENAAIQDRLGSPDVLSARALASLDKLLGLSHGLFGPATRGLFLKGREAEAEVAQAQRAWQFEYELVPSITDADGRIVIVRGPEANAA